MSTAEDYALAGKPGRSGQGILHTKVFRMGSYVIIGSANWTVSSKANVEMSSLMLLSETGVREFDWRCEFLLSKAISLTQECEEHAIQQREERQAWKRTSRTTSPSRGRDAASARRSPLPRAPSR